MPSNSEFISKLSGRPINPNSQYCQTRTIKSAVDGTIPFDSKYQALNISKPDTIELRIFRGTINPLSFMKNIEFAHAYHAFCDLAGITDLSWKKFIYWVTSPDRRGEYYHLVVWLARNFTAKDGLHPTALKLGERFTVVPDVTEDSQPKLTDMIKDKR